MTLGLAVRLKNSDFVLENKMVQLNQNKWKQTDWPDAVWKLYLWKNNNTFDTTVYTCLHNPCSKSIRKCNWEKLVQQRNQSMLLNYL